MPQISLITITYNSSTTILDTLNSVASQDFKDFEYIVVDGASTDGTIRIIDAHEVRVDKLISEPDRGLYDALNKGIDSASGDVLGFIHSDDVFANDQALTKIAACFRDGVDACYGDLQYVSSDDPEKVIRYWKSGELSISKLRRGWMPPHPTFYMRRELYQRLGGYDDSLRISADYDAMMRYLYKQRVCAEYLPEVMVKMKQGGVSNRSLKAIKQKMREDIIAMRNNEIFWPIALAVKNLSKLPQFFRT